MVDESKLAQRQKAEEKRLAEMMIPKKNKRLYNKIMFSKKKKAQEVCHSFNVKNIVCDVIIMMTMANKDAYVFGMFLVH